MTHIPCKNECFHIANLWHVHNVTVWSTIVASQCSGPGDETRWAYLCTFSHIKFTVALTPLCPNICGPRQPWEVK